MRLPNLKETVAGALLLAYAHGAGAAVIKSKDLGGITSKIEDEMGIGWMQRYHLIEYTITVENGDTLSAIARDLSQIVDYQITYQELAEKNGLKNPHHIRPEQKLIYSDKRITEGYKIRGIAG
ncbi:MAG: LysM domain-containing protein [Candidatus Aenigmatarchaeota archaeon]